ncbi:MAG: hypothetical protein ACI4PO_06880 [Faecousia sp.]
MKVLSAVVKITVALAAVAGAVYVLATYGDKIVAWAKRMLGCLECAPAEDDPAEEADAVPCCEEPAPAEAPAPVEEPAAEEPVSEPSSDVVAKDTDFEG